ncbi:hypothetical protein GCM10009682_24470 [Luedemannella flava]|uniref:DUF1622 domain-containing protein n=1 Tax=Luedemannella flava TaxID=349316 RepID=A0ABP4Y671_9ACTN
MKVEIWQVPILVMAAVVALEFIGGTVLGWLRRNRPAAAPAAPRPGSYLRIAVHAVLALAATALLVAMFMNMGTSTGAKVTTLASMVIDLVAVRLTYQSIQQMKADNEARQALRSSPGAGDAPAS